MMRKVYRITQFIFWWLVRKTSRLLRNVCFRVFIIHHIPRIVKFAPQLPTHRLQIFFLATKDWVRNAFMKKSEPLFLWNAYTKKPSTHFKFKAYIAQNIVFMFKKRGHHHPSVVGLRHSSSSRCQQYVVSHNINLEKTVNTFGWGKKK